MSVVTGMFQILFTLPLASVTTSCTLVSRYAVTTLRTHVGVRTQGTRVPGYPVPWYSQSPGYWHQLGMTVGIPALATVRMAQAREEEVGDCHPDRAAGQVQSGSHTEQSDTEASHKRLHSRLDAEDTATAPS
eukprot:3935600-Rhodomonas_salina.1